MNTESVGCAVTVKYRYSQSMMNFVWDMKSSKNPPHSLPLLRGEAGEETRAKCEV